MTFTIFVVYMKTRIFRLSFQLIDKIIPKLSYKFPNNSITKVLLACTVGENVNWYSHYGEQYGGSLKN